MMITVTKKFAFSYAHFLPGYEGDCQNLHGHNSEVEVEFMRSSEMPPAYGGMVVDFKDIKKIVGPIIDKLDHTCLNNLFNNPKYPPTAEAITKWLAQKIKATELGPGLSRIRVSETPDSFCEWRL